MSGPVDFQSLLSIDFVMCPLWPTGSPKVQSEVRGPALRVERLLEDSRGAHPQSRPRRPLWPPHCAIPAVFWFSSGPIELFQYLLRAVLRSSAPLGPLSNFRHLLRASRTCLSSARIAVHPMALDDSMRKSHEPVIAAVEDVLEAIRAVQRSLRESEERTEENLARLRSADRVADVVRQAPVSIARVDINEALTA
jgi:hypothetical protein